MFLTFNGTIVAVIVNFLVMLWIIKRFLFKPIGQILADRQKKIQSELEVAERALSEAKAVRDDADRLLAEARTEQQGLIKRAQEQADVLRAELRGKVQQEVAAMKLQAQTDLVSERESLARQMRHDAATLALVAAEKILEQVMDETLHQRLLNASQAEFSQEGAALA